MENGNGRPQKTLAEIRQEIKNYFTVCQMFSEPVPVPAKRIDRKLEAQAENGKPLEDNPKPAIPDRWLIER